MIQHACNIEINLQSYIEIAEVEFFHMNEQKPVGNDWTQKEPGFPSREDAKVRNGAHRRLLIEGRTTV